MCVSWNIFNRIHVFAICDVYLLQLSFLCVDTCTYMIIIKVDEAASTNFFLITHDISYVVCTCLLFHIAVCINTAVAEQSLHHNIILEKQDHPSVSRTGTVNRKMADEPTLHSSKSTIILEFIDKRRENRTKNKYIYTRFLRSVQRLFYSFLFCPSLSIKSSAWQSICWCYALHLTFFIYFFLYPHAHPHTLYRMYAYFLFLDLTSILFLFSCSVDVVYR